MPDHRVCLDGIMLKGVVFPKSGTMQASVMKKLLVWYFPCFELQSPSTGSGTYKLNIGCLMYRESNRIHVQRITKILTRKLVQQLGIVPKYVYTPLTKTEVPIGAR